MHALSSNRSNTITRLAVTAWLLFQYGVGLSYYSNMAAGTVTIPTWRQARVLMLGPTNYEQFLHLSEWVSEWHICISESPQQTSFYALHLHEFKNVKSKMVDPRWWVKWRHHMMPQLEKMVSPSSCRVNSVLSNLFKFISLNKNTVEGCHQPPHTTVGVWIGLIRS